LRPVDGGLLVDLSDVFFAESLKLFFELEQIRGFFEEVVLLFVDPVDVLLFVDGEDPAGFAAVEVL